MFPARVYAGQIIAVFAIVIVAIRGASRWAAAALGYQAALGPAWFAVLRFPVYLPWRLFEWWYACAWLIKLVTARRWANVKEIVAAGLYKPKGVFLGRVGVAYQRHDGPEHVMRFAPTSCGKGVALLPTLPARTPSAIVHDIEGENWRLTGGWQSTFFHCLLFNPANPNSARYTPLLEV